MSRPNDARIIWFKTEECWMAQQSIAVVGKIWVAKDPTKGFYWTAAAWATEHATGKTGNGYAQTIEEAKKRVEEICRELCSECGQVKEHQNHWAPFGWHNFEAAQ